MCFRFIALFFVLIGYYNAATGASPFNSTGCSIILTWMISGPPNQRKECMPLLVSLNQPPYFNLSAPLPFTEAPNTGDGLSNCTFYSPTPGILRLTDFTPYSEPLASNLAQYSPWLLDELIQTNSWSHFGPSVSMTLGASDTILLQNSCDANYLRVYIKPGPPPRPPLPPTPPCPKKPPRSPPPSPPSPPPEPLDSPPPQHPIDSPPLSAPDFSPPYRPPPTPPSPTPSPSSSSTGLSPPVASSLLNFHNIVRSNYPGLNPLAWSHDLSVLAAQMNSQCNYTHMSKNLYLGENLALGWMEPLTLGQLWYTTEACTYNYSSPGLFQAGHFTQIVWKTVSRVGCAFVGPNDCPSIYFEEKDVFWRGASMLRCLYDPPGNFQGSLNYILNVLPPLRPPAAIPPGCSTGNTTTR